MNTFGKSIVAGALVFAFLQVLRPGIPSRPATAEIQAPPEVRQILEKDCYSCHSDQRRLSWFDEIVPAYWLVRRDILTARQHVNFSTIGSRPAAIQKSTLYEAVNMIQFGEMPLPQYVKLHPEAKVTPDELATLKAYLTASTPAPGQPDTAAKSSSPSTAPAPTQAPFPISLSAVRPEPSGFPFDPTFETWKPISTTDRGDNNTFRFILGNDIAIKAAQSGNISPWPNGASFAKIAWQQESGPDGLLHPGKFIQVELMLKDARPYKATEGWGWGRWRGMDLKPYGNDEHFVNECTGCHRPLRANDFVYTLPITAARVSRTEAVNNTAAALPTSMPYQPLTWNAITMYVDPKTHTTATLYGNRDAMRAVQPHGAAPVDGTKNPDYPAGAVLALVTWTQRDDPHWFGARIPDALQSVEFLQVAAPGQKNTYRRFAGPTLTEEPAANTSAQRTSVILNLAPAQLP